MHMIMKANARTGMISIGFTMHSSLLGLSRKMPTCKPLMLSRVDPLSVWKNFNLAEKNTL